MLAGDVEAPDGAAVGNDELAPGTPEGVVGGVEGDDVGVVDAVGDVGVVVGVVDVSLRSVVSGDDVVSNVVVGV